LAGFPFAVVYPIDGKPQSIADFLQGEAGQALIQDVARVGVEAFNGSKKPVEIFHGTEGFERARRFLDWLG